MLPRRLWENRPLAERAATPVPSNAHTRGPYRMDRVGGWWGLLPQAQALNDVQIPLTLVG